ncbi:MAG: NERD domain-containing protein [Wenzhouxiangella sp.]
MARLDHIKPYTALERHRQQIASHSQRRRQRLMLGIPLALGLVLLTAWFNPVLAVPLGGVLAMVLFFASLTGGSNVDPGQLIGIEGEVRTLKALSQLDDRFTVFNRLRLPDPTLPNGQRELDFVVLSPSGLWIIEVKNLPGLIDVQPESHRWPVQVRAGCGGAPGWRQMDNPLKQLAAQLASMDRWLLSEGLHSPVYGLVCFARPGVGLRGDEQQDQPVTLVDGLVERIRPQSDSATHASCHPKLKERLAAL